jgi:hypothetical protein
MGSWGLPEFGVTEAIGNLFGAPRTAQGGSNLNLSGMASSTPTYNGPISSPGVNYSTGGSVLGGSTYKSPTLSSGGTTTSQPTYQDPYAGVTSSTQDEAAAQLQALNTEYDRNKSELEAQLAQAGTARTQGLSSLQGAVDEYGNLIKNQRTSAEQSAAKNIQSAGSAARQTQGKSRNILRALGILSSSAAGDILSRPMTEFAGQRAEINQATTARLQQLDDAFAQKTSEHANLVAQLESQYGDIVGRIQSDLRFSDRERADAIAAANSALLSRLSEIKMAQANWQNEINAQKNALTSSGTSLASFTNPSADIGAIQSTALNPQQQYKPGQQVSIYGTDKRLSDLYGSGALG